MNRVIKIDTPNPKQDLFLKATQRHVGFGGARGGGKSWAVRTKAILLGFKYPGIKMLIIRKSYPEIVKNHIEPLMAILYGVCKYNKTEKIIYFPNGSQIICGYCKDDTSVDQYQGQEYDVIFFDEATQLKEQWIKKIAASCRGANDFPKRIYYTCNPGGQGHGYIKRIFIDRKFEINENPDDYVFIQSLVTDNKVLMEKDPEYVRFLENLPPTIREAWLNGRWDVFEGAFFEEFRTSPDPQMCAEHGISVEDALKERVWTHVIEPFDIPRNWKVYHSYDWGYGKPFSCDWWAMDFDENLYLILQLYGCTGVPNEGLKWSNEEQFKEIHNIESSHKWLMGRKIYGPADPSIWDGSRGVSAAEIADKNGVYFEPGVNDRIPGWMQVRERMKFDENGYPKIYFFNTCKNAIRTIPLMMFDEHKIEDMDSDLEDHFCLSGKTDVLTDEGFRSISNLVGTEGYVISNDGKKHRYHNCCMTKKNADVLTITLEDGTEITGTSDHLLLKSDGTWIKIGDLKEGDDLWIQKS